LPGQGSTFTFEVKVQPAEPTSAPERSASGASVLLVESLAGASEILRLQLAALGARADQAASVEAAAAALASSASPQTFDAVLLHRVEPNRLAESAQELRRAAGWHIPILACVPLAGGTAEPLPTGVWPLTKPVRRAALAEAVTAAKSARDGAGVIARPSASAPGAGRRALIVDDNAVNLRIGMSLVGKLGYSVQGALDGQEALRRIESESFDLILMDCQMPVLDGYETTRALRALERDGQHLTVIAMTANNSAEDRDRCLAAGMDDYLVKPLGLAQLRETLARHAQPENAGVGSRQGS